MTALNAVEGGMPMRVASRQFGVPFTTLNRYIREGWNPLAVRANEAKRVLSLVQEQDVLAYVRWMSGCGFALTSGDLLEVVSEICKINGRLSPPGKTWTYEFVKKNQLSLRTAGDMHIGRYIAATQANFDQHFNLLQQILQNNNIINCPSHILNMDETGWSKAQQFKRKVIVPRGTKHPSTKQAISLDHITSVHTHSAAGDILPTLVIFKNCYPRYMNVPDSLLVCKSESGFINKELFLFWITAVLIPWCLNYRRRNLDSMNKPFLLTMDNASPHLSYEAMQKCVENNILIFALFPNTSAWLQPLDQLFFYLKNAMYHLARKLCLSSTGFIVNKGKFLGCLKIAEKQAFAIEGRIGKAFRNTGIYPFNPKAVTCDILRPAAPENPNENETVFNVEPATPCSSCGCITACAECLRRSNPLSKSKLLSDPICQQLLQPPEILPKKPRKRACSPKARLLTSIYDYLKYGKQLNICIQLSFHNYSLRP